MANGIEISFVAIRRGRAVRVALTTVCLWTGACESPKPVSTVASQPKQTPPAVVSTPAAVNAPAAVSTPAVTKQAVADASIRFELSAAGLPEKGMWKCDPVFVDVNRDGNLDLAAHPRKGKGPSIWLGDGKGNWSESSAGLEWGNTCGGGLAFADINKDGHLDLGVADHCNGAFIFFADGQGGWRQVAGKIFPAEITPPGEVDEFAGAEDIDLADVNGDGHIDMVLGASDKGGVSFFLGDSSGTNWQYQKSDLPTRRVCNRVKFTDVNGDGKLDLLGTEVDGPRVWLGDGTGAWKHGSQGLPTPFHGNLFRGQAVGDVNKDGRKDLIVANDVDGPEVYFQNADGSWTKSADIFPQITGGAIGVDVGDVDGDGNLDIVASGRLNREEVGFVYGLFFLKGDGTGKFRWIENSGLPPHGLGFTWGVALADVNKDGVLDLAAGSGGVVATDPKRTEPVVAPRVLMYLGRTSRSSP